MNPLKPWERHVMEFKMSPIKAYLLAVLQILPRFQSVGIGWDATLDTKMSGLDPSQVPRLT